MKTVRPLQSLAAALLLSGVAGAQVTYWDNPGVSDWFDPANWSAGIPGPGISAFFINGGTAQISGGATMTHQTTSLGTNSGGAVGYLEITDGILNSINVFVGHHGYGELTMSGANSEINASLLRMAGNLPQAEGVITINDGSIHLIGDFTPAWYGTGHVYQHGGSIVCSQIIGGQLDVAESYYVMDGGTLTAGYISCGANGHGEFTQSGNTYVNTSNLRIPGNTNGSGIYRLQAGTLDADNIHHVFNSTPGTFEMTGGRLNVDFFGLDPLHWDLVVQGGTLCPADNGVGTTQVWGRWAQGNAANYEVTFNSPTSYDTTIAEDGIVLSGKITLVLNSAPPSGTSLLVGQNNSVAPITGTFFGLPEGATVVGTFGTTSYNFAISYVGGDGNDLVLNACLGDGTGDGVIDFDDLNLVLLNWGMTGTGIPGDLDGNGVVDFDDLNLVLANWGAACV